MKLLFIKHFEIIYLYANICMCLKSLADTYLQARNSSRIALLWIHLLNKAVAEFFPKFKHQRQRTSQSRDCDDFCNPTKLSV